MYCSTGPRVPDNVWIDPELHNLAGEGGRGGVLEILFENYNIVSLIFFFRTPCSDSDSDVIIDYLLKGYNTNRYSPYQSFPTYQLRSFLQKTDYHGREECQVAVQIGATATIVEVGALQATR